MQRRNNDSNQLELFLKPCGDESKVEVQENACESEFMGKKICFSCEKHKMAFERLSETGKKYIAAYMQVGSSVKVKNLLQLPGSVRTVNKSIARHARKMGCASIQELVRTEEENSIATAKRLKEKIAQQSYRCALSGVLLTVKTAELDHIVPRSEGGTNDIENLQWVHRKINRAKGTLSQKDFVDMCRKVARWMS